MSETILATLLVINQILYAGNAITAFSLLLYALTFNVRERVARSLALLLSCVTLVYFGDVLTSLAQTDGEIELWLRVQWIGIAFVPATYLHLSDALLEATGRPSRGRRILVVFLSYLGGALTLAATGLGKTVAGELAFSDSVAYLRPGTLFPLFLFFSLIILILFSGSTADLLGLACRDQHKRCYPGSDDHLYRSLFWSELSGPRGQESSFPMDLEGSDSCLNSSGSYSDRESVKCALRIGK